MKKIETFNSKYKSFLSTIPVTLYILKNKEMLLKESTINFFIKNETVFLNHCKVKSIYFFTYQ